MLSYSINIIRGFLKWNLDGVKSPHIISTGLLTDPHYIRICLKCFGTSFLSSYSIIVWRSCKVYWRILKIFFSRTICPILTKLSASHPWMNRIQVFTNKKHSILEKEKRFLSKSTLWYKNDFAKMCLLVGNVSRVSNAAHGPLVLIMLG